MTRRVYSREYKREAALLVTMRGVSVAQAAAFSISAWIGAGSLIHDRTTIKSTCFAGATPP